VTAGAPLDILIVEDDSRLAELLSEYLRGAGYSTEIEPSGDYAAASILVKRPRLVLLDLQLPGVDGMQVCRAVRGRYSGGILMLTARTAEVDQVLGLEFGADDYVTKPADPRVLLARIRSLLRRLDGGDPEAVTQAVVVDVGALRVSKVRREATFSGRDAGLTGVEFDVLWVLAGRAGEVVTRDELYSAVRGGRYDGLDRGMDVHVSRLRRKLQGVGMDPRDLKSVRGSGYLLVRP
jgi:two-component system response regulator RstA